LVSLFSGDLLSSDDSSPTLQISGSADLEMSWTLSLGEGRILLGDPSVSELLIFESSREGSTVTENADVIIDGIEPSDELGASIALVPDLNGNGQPELLIGAPGVQFENTSRADGGVYLLTDLADLDEDSSVDEARVLLRGTHTGARLGTTVAGCADMDGDGLGEWAAAAPLDNSGEKLAGSVVLVLSSAGIQGEVLDSEVETRWTGSVRGELAGSSMSCLHDLTGDGIADLAIGAPFSDGDSDGTGRVYVISGGDLPESGTLEDASARTLEGLSRDGWTGWSIATGDVDGDGHAELAAGSPGMEDARGWVLVWDGADVAQRGDLIPDYRIRGTEAGDRFGHRVLLSDIDGDGLAELGIGAPRESDLSPQSQALGTFHLYSGSEGFVSWRPLMETDRAIVSTRSTLSSSQNALEIASGDLNGDGAAEILLLELDNQGLSP
jgi:hypothetical protein